MTKIKIFIATMAILFSANVLLADTADTIDIIVPSKEVNVIISGKPGGSFFNRSQMYIDALTAKGYNVKIDNIGNISQSVFAFKKTSNPTIMVFANNQAAINNLPHNKDNFILLEYENALFLCGSADFVKDPKIAYSKSFPKKNLLQLLKDQGISNPKMVPYKNSGAMLKAILAREVDFMISTQSKSLQYLKYNKGICHAQTSNKTFMNIPPFKTEQKVLPIMHATVIGKNINNQIKNDIREISQNKEFKEYRFKNKLNEVDNDYNSQLIHVQQHENIWKL
jgi:hypothetical protein